MRRALTMADVKWIKLNVGMFDGNSFKKIKKAKIGGESFRDKLTAVWFELMDFAGKCNAGGQLIESPEIPFSNLEDIAVLIDREPEELNLCMQYYVANRMITVIDDVYMLTNWAKYQSTDKLAEIREQNRIRQKNWYDRQKALPNVRSNVSITQPNALDIDKEIEKEKDIEIDNISTPTATKPKKHKYGIYKNVLLTDEEYKKLQERYPTDYDDKINTLSKGIEMKGYKYKSHYLACIKWADHEKPKQTVSSNPFLEMLQEV